MIYKYRDEAPPPEELFAKLDKVLTGIFDLMEEPLDVELHNKLVDMAVVLDERVNKIGNQLVLENGGSCHG